MVKLEWGTKRQCQGCSSRFYDLLKTPIICPKCGEVNEAQPANRRTRTRSTADDMKLAALASEDSVLDTDLDLDTEIDVAGEDDDLIEDTSDLSEDIDDISGIDHDDEDTDR